jgi:hypothetical protein
VIVNILARYVAAKIMLCEGPSLRGHWKVWSLSRQHNPGSRPTKHRRFM